MWNVIFARIAAAIKKKQRDHMKLNDRDHTTKRKQLR